MITLTISLILFYHVNTSFGTSLLPLEVFEMPQSTQVYSSNLNSNSNSNTNTNNNNSNNPSNNYIKHKTVFSSNSNSNSNINNLHQRSERRRSSRQMVESSVLPPHRILYQVGESEEDLPICAPNSVCSKIDLYDIPWIERQCRCPESSYNKILHHHSHSDNSNHNHGKYQSISHSEKFIQQKHLFDINGKKIEDIHLKKLMQKLQAVYKDDLILDENEFDNSDEIKNNLHYRNEYPVRKNYRQAAVKNRESNKLRHSGHRKDISYISGCPSGIGSDDGHTIADKTRQYKLCNPVHKLPLCDSFRDFTWTVTTSPEMNVTEQVVHCRCRPNSVTYLTKWEPSGPGRTGYIYFFACSPQSKLRCQRKEPCKLFTLRKRQEFLDEVNISPLCQCPKGHRCPKHHSDPGVIAGKSYVEDNIQTYSGYCMAND